MLFSKTRPATDRGPLSSLKSPPYTGRTSSPTDDVQQLQHQVQSLASQVQQWRHHGRLLSDTVRQLQDELQAERETNNKKDRLLSAQDEKISLLEQQLQQWQFCVGAAIPGNQQVVAVASQPHTPPKPPPATLPQQQPQPAWLRWLGGDKPAASTNNNNNAASEERPPPWSKWLPGGVGGGGGGNSTASGTPASTAPPTPEPRQQQQRGPSPLPHSRKENGEAASAMGMVARSPLAPATPNTPTQSSHQPQPHSQQPLVPGTPQVADWAGACTAAQRLQEQLSTAGGGTPTQQTTENFLESFLTAVTPQQPTPAREQPPRSGNHRSQRKATPPRRPPTPPPPPQQQQTTTVEVEIDLSDPSATRALLDGSSNADAPAEDAVEPSEIAARRGVALEPCVVNLGSAQEDFLDGVSPPVTTRTTSTATAGAKKSGRSRATASPTASTAMSTSTVVSP